MVYSTKPPNGMAQRQRRDWQDSSVLSHRIWQAEHPFGRTQAARPLKPVLGLVVKKN
jgi:hypothetical protein